jgi:ABC-2 type transport system ATP-binding protein
VHRPPVLFWDEPTIGLDPQTRRKIWDLIQLMNRDGMTVLLTTHYIEEADSLCHRVGIVDYGRIITLGTPLELKEKLGLNCVEFLNEQGTERNFFTGRSEALKFSRSKDCDTVVRRTNLEDVFVELTDHEARELAAK